MTLHINEQERGFLLDLLKAEQMSLLDELHHTESYEYKQMLKQKDEILKTLKSKVEAIVSETNAV